MCSYHIPPTQVDTHHTISKGALTQTLEEAKEICKLGRIQIGQLVTQTYTLHEVFIGWMTYPGLT